MSDKRDERPRGPADGDLSRRDFVALSVATGLAAATRSAGAALPVVETDVTIEAPDGSCDAAFFHPATGAHPGVLIWPDAFGLRPSMREIGRRLAGEGYAVLVPNPFYRVAKAPVYETAANIDFRDPATMRKLGPLMGSVNAPGDGREGRGRLRRLPRRAAAGRQGAGRSARRATAWAARWWSAPPPRCRTRIGAGASFHGGGLVTDKPDSPHLLAPRIAGAHVFRRRAERRPAPARGEGQAEGGVRRRQGAGARSRSIRRATAGASPTCRTKPARRSTARPMPSAPGPGCSSSTRSALA